MAFMDTYTGAQGASPVARPRKPQADLIPGAPPRYADMKWNTSNLFRDIDQQLANYGDVAWGLNDEEERRGAASEGFLRNADAAASKSTITQQEIDRQFGQKSDAASRGFLDNMAGLRDYVGGSGVTGGGHIGGIAANAELKRLQQLTTARGDLMSFKATSDALDRQRAFDRSRVVADAINRPVSMLGADFENQQLQTTLTKLGVETNRQGAADQAKASKKGFLDYLGPIATVASSFI